MVSPALANEVSTLLPDDNTPDVSLTCRAVDETTVLDRTAHREPLDPIGPFVHVQIVPRLGIVTIDGRNYTIRQVTNYNPPLNGYEDWLASNITSADNRYAWDHNTSIENAHPGEHDVLVHRFRNSNHIRRPGRACRTKYGRRGLD